MTIIAFRSVIHESTLNIKLAAASTSTLQSILPPPPSPPLSPPPKMPISRFSGWEVEGKGIITITIIIILVVLISMHACMYICMSLWKVVAGKRCACKLCIPLCASHDNVMRACTNAILSGTVQCMVDGWMDDCDEWQLWYVVRSFLWTSDGEEMSNWMNACKHGWTDSCLCVCLCMCMWLVGSRDLFAGWSSLHWF